MYNTVFEPGTPVKLLVELSETTANLATFMPLDLQACLEAYDLCKVWRYHSHLQIPVHVTTICKSLQPNLHRLL